MNYRTAQCGNGVQPASAKLTVRDEIASSLCRSALIPNGKSTVAQNLRRTTVALSSGRRNVNVIRLVVGAFAVSMTGAVAAGPTVPLGTSLGVSLGVGLGSVLGFPLGAVLPVATGGLLTVAAASLVAGIWMVRRKKRR
jgi:hypothetical protein